MTTSESKIQLRVGDEHPIRLESLLSAGYEWQPESHEGGEVAQVRKAAPTEGEEAVGASPDEVFTVKAVRPGKARLRFAQRRPWEKEGKPAKEHVLDLEVSE